MRVVEYKDTHGIRYKLITGSKTKSIGVVCKEIAVPNREDGRAFVFYDTDTNLLYDPSSFITSEYNSVSDNSRLQAISAMKALYSFSMIVGSPPCSFDDSLCRAFTSFVRGTLSDGFNYSFQLSSMRSETTLDAYLNAIRRFMRFMGCVDSPFLKKKERIGCFYATPDSESFKIKAKVLQATTAPRYISLDEYQRILGVIDTEFGPMERAMVRLMFEHGLRLGEVLGLTTEDLKMDLRKDGSMMYSIVLRNRVEDRTDQRAKNLLTATNLSHYKSSLYLEHGVGYHQVYISESMFEDLSLYVEMAHGDLDAERSSRCAASSVEGRDSNHYIFLSSRGTPLSANLWSKKLRRIYSLAEIPVDKGGRKTNLSHRLRHGYAMFLRHVAGVPEFEIMTLLRHRSISSTEMYNRPTAEDVRELQLSATSRIRQALFARDGIVEDAS